MLDMKEPSLLREIGRVAWYITKALVPMVVLTGLLFYLLRNHPVIAMWAWCGLLLVSQIVYYGWQDYKWKKRDWQRQQQEESDRKARNAKNAGNPNGW